MDPDRVGAQLDDDIAGWLDRTAMAAGYYYTQLRRMDLPDEVCVALVIAWHDEMLSSEGGTDA